MFSNLLCGSKRILSQILLIVVFASSISCSNFFKEAADKSTDEAKLEEIRKLMNSQDWDLALAEFEELSESQKSQVATIETWASAYAGKCGLNFVSYFNNLSEASLGGTTLFKYFMNAFTGVSVNPSSCYSAQLKMEEISTDPAERSSGQNLFMAILGMVKVGTYLRNIADKDGTGGLGDGNADTPTYNSCNTSSLSDNDVKQIMTGIGLITTNLADLTDAISEGTITDTLGSLETLCSGSCGDTNINNVSALEVLLLRNILATGSSNGNTGQNLGIDNTCLDDISTDPCCT